MPSRVWNYFTRSSDKAKATYDLCKKVFDYKGTRNSFASDFVDSFVFLNKNKKEFKTRSMALSNC